MSRPGILVFAGLNSPRNSAGASGFRSNVSRWLCPPCRKMKISDTSFFGFAVSLGAEQLRQPEGGAEEASRCRRGSRRAG